MQEVEEVEEEEKCKDCVFETRLASIYKQTQKPASTLDVRAGMRCSLCLLADDRLSARTGRRCKGREYGVVHSENESKGTRVRITQHCQVHAAIQILHQQITAVINQCTK